MPAVSVCVVRETSSRQWLNCARPGVVSEMAASSRPASISRVRAATTHGRYPALEDSADRLIRHVSLSRLRIAHILRGAQVSARLSAVRRELATTIEAAVAPRRELYKERTRLELALAAFELAKSEGLAAVRVPQIAEAAGVSPRTFNNYFASKEQAIAWLAGRHAAGMATTLRERPVDEPLGSSLVEAVLGQYRPAREDGLPPYWLRDFRALVVREPDLYGEYLTAVSSAERDLGDAITERVASVGPLQARVLAAMVVGAERAAVMYWMQTRAGSLMATVREAVEQAIAGIGHTP